MYTLAAASLAPITAVPFCVRPPSKPVKANFACPFSVLLCVPMTSSVALTKKEVHSRRARIVIVESFPSSLAFPASRYVPSLHRQQTTHAILTDGRLKYTHGEPLVCDGAGSSFENEQECVCFDRVFKCMYDDTS